MLHRMKDNMLGRYIFVFEVYFLKKKCILKTSWLLAPYDFCKHKEKNNNNTKTIKFLYTAMKKTSHIRIMQAFV